MDLTGHDPDFDPFEGTVRCERCNEPIEVSDYYIYKGETLCKNCILDLECEVATRVK